MGLKDFTAIYQGSTEIGAAYRGETQVFGGDVPDPSAPTNTVAPSITGTAAVGQTLTAAVGTWTGSPSYARQWLRNGTAISGATGTTYLLISADEGASISVRITATNAGGSAQATSAGVGPVAAAPVAPSQITTWTWTTGLAASQIVASITAPSDGGSAITGYEYSLDGGTTAIPLTGASPWTLTMAAAGTSYTAVVRAVNAIGAGAWSTSKTATSGTAAATAPAQFGTGDWSVATGASANQITLTVSTLPSDGGSAITALQYTIDGGTTWTALSGTGTGARTLTMAASGTAYTFALRAVNAVGNGTSSATKSATSGAAAATPPSAFAAGDWTFATAAVAGNTTLTISAVPTGTTYVDYTFDGGATVHTLGTKNTGARMIPPATSGAANGASVSCQIRARNSAGSSAWASAKTANAGAAPAGATTKTAFAITPFAHYHAALGVTEASGAVTQWADQSGTGAAALLAANSLTTKRATDSTGRQYLYVDGASTGLMGLEAALSYDSGNLTVLAICAPSNVGGINGIMATSAASSNNPMLSVSYSADFGILPRAFTSPTSAQAQANPQTQAAGRLNMVGICWRNGGIGNANYLFGNGTRFSATRSTNGSTRTVMGAVGYGMRIYELVVFSGQPTDAEVTAATTAMMANWGINTDRPNMLVFEGDSITYGAGPLADNNAVSRAKGIPYGNQEAKQIPGDFLVLNTGTSGNMIEDLVTQNQSATNWTSLYTSANIPGRRVVALQIGRNNIGVIGTGSDISGLPTYQAMIVDLLTNATYGYLSLGWEVIMLGNIGGAPQMIAARNWIMSPEFLTAVQAGPGQTYEGKVRCRNVAISQLSDGYTPIAVTSDEAGASGHSGYWSDGTHPSGLGTELFATGGSTPQNGALFDLA